MLLNEQTESRGAGNSPRIEVEASLYGGSITIQRGDFGHQKHAYFWKEKGLFVPGATSVLGILDKPALIQWAANKASEHVEANLQPGASKEEIKRVCAEAKSRHVRLKEEGGEVGHSVHELAHKLFLGQPIVVPDDKATKNGLIAIQEWLRSNDVRPIDIEQICFSKLAYFAGTFDLLCSLNGKLTLCDLKTSNFVYDEHKMQLGGYRFAWEEEHHGEHIEQLCIIHLNKKTGKMKPYIWSDIAAMDFFSDTFLRTKALSENLKKMGDY